jgi:hypothetical protein
MQTNTIIKFVCILITLAVFAAYGYAQETIDLTTNLPAEQVDGTPVPVKLPNLEPEAQAIPTLKVPVGTVNLAKGKSVSGSDEFPIIGELAFLTDGDKDAGEGFFAEFGSGTQWVQIDLEKEAAIYAIWIWHYHSQKRAYHDIIAQISNDADFVEGVTTVFNNDYDNSSGKGVGKDRPYIETRYGKLIPVNGVKGRYVRLYSKGNTSNDMNHYIEAEVFGVPPAQ